MKAFPLFLSLMVWVGMSESASAQDVRWAPVPGAEVYEYQVATGSEFSSAQLIDSGSTEQTRLSLELPPGAYFYRVRSVDRESRVGTWSAAQKFVVGTNALRITSPAQQADLVLENRFTPVAFSWTAVEGATSYEVLVRHGARVRTLVSSAPALSVADFAPGTHNYRIVAKSRGVTLTESAQQTLRVRFLSESERLSTDAQRLTWVDPTSVVRHPVVWETLDLGVGWLGLSSQNSRLNKQSDPDENGVVTTTALQPSFHFGTKLIWNRTPKNFYSLSYQNTVFGVLSESQEASQKLGFSVVPTALQKQSLDLGWGQRWGDWEHSVALGVTGIGMLGEDFFLTFSAPFVQVVLATEKKFRDQIGFVPFVRMQIEQPVLYVGPGDIRKNRGTSMWPGAEFRAGVLRGLINTMLLKPSARLRFQYWEDSGARFKHGEFQASLQISIIWAP